MAKTINCFIPFADENQVSATVAELKANALVNKIYLLQLQTFQSQHLSLKENPLIIQIISTIKLLKLEKRLFQITGQNFLVEIQAILQIQDYLPAQITHRVFQFT